MLPLICTAVTRERHVVMLVLIPILVIIIIFISVWVYSKLACGMCKFSGHLVGKVVIVTGANSGIGFETAKDLAQRGAYVILGCRNMEKAETAKEEIITSSGNKNVYILKLDLESLTSVKTFVAKFSQLTDRLDILINNAGQYGTERKMTDDGLLQGMQINYFGPFLLTALLLPLLIKSAPSRIINVSSMLYKYGVVNLDDLNMENERDSLVFKHKVYFNAKLCTMLMTTELERRLKGTGVTVNALHPGAVNTQIANQVIMYIMRPLFNLVQSLFFKSPWEGAQTTIYLAVSPDVEQISGYYFKDCRLKSLCSRSQDLLMARQLWKQSEKLVKL